ncbi:MAG: hypothetical protein AB199_01225 [Parcubacteria bacterium C7867-004]|nr:MAG: hypothetical protein AB199_01225 [Parcubacteria bacterium C7867-004]
MEETASGPINFINVEYFFRLLYEAVTQLRTGSFGGDWLMLASTIWMFVTLISLVISAAFLTLLIHSHFRLHRVLDGEEDNFSTIHPEVAEVTRDHNRWGHIRALIESPHENDWRQAIIEADIMLDDLLSQLGYPGVGVGEKLRAVDPSRFRTLDNAWEAHKVRNEIAHQGMSTPLEEHRAHRTIAHYEAVMREHGEI